VQVIALKGILIAAILIVSLVPVQCESPRILVDTAHGGYPLKDGRLSEFRHLAREKGFSADFKKMETVILEDYALVISANPDREFSPEDCTRLREYLVQGGTFFVTGAGDFENRDHSEVTNPLLEAVGTEIRFNDDQVTDIINSGKFYIPLFDQWQPHPLTANLPPISLYSPESVITGENVYSLLQGNATSESTDSDGSTVTTAVNPVTLLAVQQIGKGTLLVGGSWGFLSGFSFAGHQEFVEKLLWYISGERVTLPFFQEAFQGASIVVGERCRPEVDRTGAEILSGLLGGDTSPQGLKTVIIGGPAVNPLVEEINPYLPIQFGKDRAWYITKDGHKFYGQEYGIVAVVVVDGVATLLVAGLGGTGTAGAVRLLLQYHQYTVIPTYNEYGEAVLIKVSGDTNQNGLQEESEMWNILTL
jgi:hypothetical protein